MIPTPSMNNIRTVQSVFKDDSYFALRPLLTQKESFGELTDSQLKEAKMLLERQKIIMSTGKRSGAGLNSMSRVDEDMKEKDKFFAANSDKSRQVNCQSQI